MQPRAADGKKANVKLFYDLFYRSQGVVKICSSAEGQFSFSGHFSSALSQSLCMPSASIRPDGRNGTVTWQDFFPKLQMFPGAPEFKGTPEEANARYEKGLIWLWLSHASYPTFIGVPQAPNLLNIQPERTWGNMTVVRYPSRRTFLKLISHPAYASLAPYKLIAVELDLVPVSSGIIVPDLRWLVAGGFAIVFLLVVWLHAAHVGVTSCSF